MTPVGSTFQAEGTAGQVLRRERIWCLQERHGGWWRERQSGYRRWSQGVVEMIREGH